MNIGSIFGGIFSTASTAIGGFFSTAKAYIMVAVVVLFLLLVGGFYFYYNWSQGQIATLTANQAQLQDALKTQTDNFNQLKKDSDNLVKSYRDLQNKENQIQKQNDELSKKIHAFDFNTNAIKNHDATEKDINDQTDQMLKNFEHLSDPDNLSDPSDPVNLTPTKKGN